MKSEAKSLSFFLSVAFAAIAISFTGFYLNRFFYHDDAFISLRYAYNLIHGNGLTWNPMERVEGYSNFLYIILISLTGRMGFDLVTASRVVNISAFITLIVFMWLYLKHIGEDGYLRDIAFIPLIFTATSFPLITWTLGGLETPLFTLLCTMGIWLVSDAINGRGGLSSVIISSVAFSLSVMTRPDGIIFVLITVIFLYAAAIKDTDGRNDNGLYIFIGVFLWTFLPYLFWKVYYYGGILPNTYYVRAVGVGIRTIGEGFAYVMYYWAYPPYIFPILVIVLQYSLFKRKWDRRMSYLSSIIAVYLIYIVYIGGDHMPAYRFIAPLIPPSLLLLYLGLRSLSSRLYGKRVLLVYINLLFLVSLQIREFVPLPYNRPVLKNWRPADVLKIQKKLASTSWKAMEKKYLAPRRIDPPAFLGAIVGKYIAKNWPEGSLIALNTAGAVPYFAPKNRYIDMLGVNDPFIAKRTISSRPLPWQFVPGYSKGDGAYVLSKNPDYIIVGPIYGNDISIPVFLSDLEMSRNPEFYNNYEWHRVKIDVGYIEGYENYKATHSGFMTFIYYKRTNSPIPPK